MSITIAKTVDLRSQAKWGLTLTAVAKDSADATITSAAMDEKYPGKYYVELTFSAATVGLIYYMNGTVCEAVEDFAAIVTPTAAENAAATIAGVPAAVDVSTTAGKVTAIDTLVKEGGAGDLAEMATNGAEALATVGVTGVVVGAADKASIVAGMWAALTSSLTTAGSVGKWLFDNMLNAASRTGAYPAGVLVNAPKTELALTDVEKDAIAAKILATPSNKLATDATGKVTTANPTGSTTSTVEITNISVGD